VAGSAYLTDVTEQGTFVGWTETVGEEFRQQAIAGTVREGLTTRPRSPDSQVGGTTASRVDDHPLAVHVVVGGRW
jgi:hypothetical protein